VRDWTGHGLDDVNGAGVGRIEGAFAEQGGGPARWLLARMGRFGHYTLVPARDAVEAAGRVWVPYTRDQIRRGPRVEPKAALDAGVEPALIAHYGLADYG
jgi:hypothetical protein